MPNVYPNRAIFEYPPQAKAEVQDLGGYLKNEYLKTYHPPEGGTYTRFLDSPFDLKGHPFKEAIISTNTVKRLILALFKTLLPKRHWLEGVLYDFARLGESIYAATPPDEDGIRRNPILKEQYYNKLPKELWRLWTKFFIAYGVSKDVAYKSGRLLATAIHYDDAYYGRVADIFTEMDAAALYQRPFREIGKALRIYNSREHFKEGVGKSINTFGNLARYALLWPPARKAFRTALHQITFSNLQLDDADRYHAFNRVEYDVCGNSFEERKHEYERLRQLHLSKTLRTIRLTINNNTMPATQNQIDKVTAALSPLYSDPDFATVTDMNVAVTQTPPVPAPEVDQIDVTNPQ